MNFFKKLFKKNKEEKAENPVIIKEEHVEVKVDNSSSKSQTKKNPTKRNTK